MIHNKYCDAGGGIMGLVRVKGYLVGVTRR